MCKHTAAVRFLHLPGSSRSRYDCASGNSGKEDLNTAACEVSRFSNKMFLHEWLVLAFQHTFLSFVVVRDILCGHNAPPFKTCLAALWVD